MLMRTTQTETRSWRMVNLELLFVLGITFWVLHAQASSRDPHGKSGYRGLVWNAEGNIWISKLPQSDLATEKLSASGFGELSAKSLKHVEDYSQPREGLHAEVSCSKNCYRSRATAEDPPTDSVENPGHGF